MKNAFLAVFFIILLTGCETKISDANLPIPVSENISEKSLNNTDTEKTNNYSEENNLLSKNNKESKQISNSYTINIEINPENDYLNLIEKINIKNNTENSINTICLTTYANTLKYKYLDFDTTKEINKNSFFNIKSITVNNQNVKYYKNNSYIGIFLNEPLKSGSEISLLFQFESNIPKLYSFSGQNENLTWFGSFIPTVLNFNETNQSYFGNLSAITPYLGELSDFKVTASYPKNYNIIAEGLENTTEQSDKKISYFTDKYVRDFSFAIYKENKVNKKTISVKDNFSINFYYYSEYNYFFDNYLDSVKEYVEYCIENIGSYPYQELNIVETELENNKELHYPQTVFVDSNYLKSFYYKNWSEIDYGKQWFNCTIGTNSENDILFEGLTNFLGYCSFYPKNELKFKMKEMYDKLNETQNLKTDINFITTNDDYNILSGKSTLMIYSLYETLGIYKFNKLVKDFYINYSFSKASFKDFFDLAEYIDENDLYFLYDTWINSDELPEFPKNTDEYY